MQADATQHLAPDAEGIARAAALLRAGHLVAFATETVYGIGADATSPRAVAALYAAKGRPRFNPLIAHVADLAAARTEGIFDARAQQLAAWFWPGPLTLVVPRAPGGTVCDLAAAGLPTLGLRIPAHGVALALLQAAGRPVAAPSANRSGRVSPTCPAHVLADLDGRIAAIIEAGVSPVGVESTIVACLADEPVRLLRPGGIATERIEHVLGERLERTPHHEAAPVAPGMLASHYAPRACVRLDVTEIRPGEALLTFAGARPPGSESAVAIRDLSASGDLTEAASRLFAHLRDLDGSGAACIGAVTIPRHGLGEAILDRLARAAAPRG